MASTIGWALVADYRLILIGLIIGTPLLIYFGDVFKIEKGHSYYPYVIALAGGYILSYMVFRRSLMDFYSL